MKIIYSLPTLGIDIEPVNRQNIYLEIVHDQERLINEAGILSVGLKNFFLAREDVRRIMVALNTNPGITEGLPLDIHISELNQVNIINMYVDFMDGFQRSDDVITASIKMLQSIDWLDDKTDAFTFESMY